MAVDTQPPTADTPAEHHAVWRGPHLLDAGDLDAREIRSILGRAKIFEGTPPSEVRDLLRGYRFANLFFEDSTRTRISFSTAAQRLGADTLDLTAPGSSVAKGESLIDTALTVEAGGADGLVIRSKAAGGPALAARHTGIPVINAGDGRHQHPTQGLLDAYALSTALDRRDFDLGGLRLAIVGDIANSRVARSDLRVFTALGASVVFVGPRPFAPTALSCLGCEVVRSLDDVLPEIDALQMLRVQFERHGGPAPISRRQYRHSYGLTPARASRMKPGAIVMHPGPANRGLEIDGPVADNLLPTGPRSIIRDQVRSGTLVRMAVLAMTMGR